MNTRCQDCKKEISEKEDLKFLPNVLEGKNFSLCTSCYKKHIKEMADELGGYLVKLNKKKVKK